MSRRILDDLNKSIQDLEKTATEEIHSEKWKRCVEHVKAKGDVDNAYAVCTASLGDDSFKSFAQSDALSSDDLLRINGTLLKNAADKMNDLLKGFSFEEDDVTEEPATATSPGILATPTLDMLYGQPPLRKTKVIGGR